MRLFQSWHKVYIDMCRTSGVDARHHHSQQSSTIQVQTLQLNNSLFYTLITYTRPAKMKLATLAALLAIAVSASPIEKREVGGVSLNALAMPIQSSLVK